MNETIRYNNDGNGSDDSDDDKGVRDILDVVDTEYSLVLCTIPHLGTILCYRQQTHIRILLRLSLTDPYMHCG